MIVVEFWRGFSYSHLSGFNGNVLYARNLVIHKVQNTKNFDLTSVGDFLFYFKIIIYEEAVR